MPVESLAKGVLGDNPTEDRRDLEQLAKLAKTRLVGASRWVARARDAALAHAQHDSPLLITGEIGAGKEFLARLIHDLGPRADRPFVSTSSHSISQESFEAILFGSVRSQRTGRRRIQRGLIERANEGTLYVSGFSRLSAEARARLVHLIQYKEFHHVGDRLMEWANVRIIVGTAHSPDAVDQEADTLGIADKLAIPPLKQRANDIDLLARHFIAEVCDELGKERRLVSLDAMALLKRYEWPGHVGELKRVIRRMVEVSGPPLVDRSCLPPRVAELELLAGLKLPADGANLAEEMKRFEVSLLTEALRQARGVQSRAAELLGLSLTTLHSKITRYGISPTRFKGD